LNGFDYNNISEEKSFLVSLVIQKVLKLSNRGSQENYQPFSLNAEGLSLFFINYFYKKEGFFKLDSVFIIYIIKI